MTQPRQKELHININVRNNRGYHPAASKKPGINSDVRRRSHCNNQWYSNDNSGTRSYVSELLHQQQPAHETIIWTCQRKPHINRDQRYGNHVCAITVSSIVCINIDWRSEPNDDTATPAIAVNQQQPVPAIAVHQWPPAVLQPKP